MDPTSIEETAVLDGVARARWRVYAKRIGLTVMVGTIGTVVAVAVVAAGSASAAGGCGGG